MRPFSARLPLLYRSMTAATSSSRVAMLTRLIATSPTPSGSGAFQMRQRLNIREHFWRGNAPLIQMSVTRDMSGVGSTRSVRFVPEGSHAAGGQNGPDHRCDWVASSEEVELRGGGGAVGDERAALSPAARCL